MAAGLGFKTFTTGEVLTAADVNGYLMQGVLVFASAAARNAAITSPQEGQFAFTKDTNGLWYYDGAAWVASGATGDIEGVTAGVGISGGGTSGTVTITNSMATAIDAKGDLVAGTAADTFSRLAVGANNTVLTADSAEATGLKWAAPAGGGKVLQVVSNTYSTQTSIQSTTMTDTGLSATITPTASTSKILVLVTQNFLSYVQSGGRGGAYQLVRGSTAINVIGSGGYEYTFDDSSTTVNGRNFRGVQSVVYMDSPATTSATTYKTQGKVYSTANNSNLQFQDNNVTNSIILMEIGA
jgi:hypothetical protein